MGVQFGSSKLGTWDHYGKNPGKSSMKVPPCSYGKMGVPMGKDSGVQKGTQMRSGVNMLKPDQSGSVAQPARQPGVPKQSSLNPDVAKFGKISVRGK